MTRKQKVTPWWKRFTFWTLTDEELDAEVKRPRNDKGLPTDKEPRRFIGIKWTWKW